mmetsp:Transcript_39259/g.108178  ORF Transcript_39259/g.108178 Transcript_39259/m.108178 type:complete len:288 (-) Transcript_39259:667-1530(-)
MRYQRRRPRVAAPKLRIGTSSATTAGKPLPSFRVKPGASQYVHTRPKTHATCKSDVLSHPFAGVNEQVRTFAHWPSWLSFKMCTGSPSAAQAQHRPSTSEGDERSMTLPPLALVLRTVPDLEGLASRSGFAPMPSSPPVSTSPSRKASFCMAPPRCFTNSRKVVNTSRVSSDSGPRWHPRPFPSIHGPMLYKNRFRSLAHRANASCRLRRPSKPTTLFDKSTVCNIDSSSIPSKMRTMASGSSMFEHVISNTSVAEPSSPYSMASVNISPHSASVTVTCLQPTTSAA